MIWNRIFHLDTIGNCFAKYEHNWQIYECGIRVGILRFYVYLTLTYDSIYIGDLKYNFVVIYTS